MMLNYNWYFCSVVLTLFICETTAHFYPIKPPILPTYTKHYGLHKPNELHLSDYINAVDVHGFPDIKLEPDFPQITEIGPQSFLPPHINPHSLFPTPSFHRFAPIVHHHHEPEIVTDVRHKDVVLTSLQEQALPSHLRNPFYKNPRIRAGLAKHSWFHHGEMPVFEREASKIPREEIYKILWNAGFLRNHHH
ncbi:uncharacterized protein LOC123293009 [Chrysoperla carnea]|uniref:uncharacterized protein LOC123293009 n=1 Tax=Chrysoperla carnea TaxID=189513 RepID=UPI001D0958B9|nr:uncharacterized protein LOC123293009 [Chrysoperla carnea]